MHDDGGGGVGDDGRPKDFARVAKQYVEQTSGDDEMPQNIPAGVQHDAHQRFHVRIVAGVSVNVRLPVRGGVLPPAGRAPGEKVSRLLSAEIQTPLRN